VLQSSPLCALLSALRRRLIPPLLLRESPLRRLFASLTRVEASWVEAPRLPSETVSPSRPHPRVSTAREDGRPASTVSISGRSSCWPSRFSVARSSHPQPENHRVRPPAYGRTTCLLQFQPAVSLLCCLDATYFSRARSPAHKHHTRDNVCSPRVSVSAVETLFIFDHVFDTILTFNVPQCPKPPRSKNDIKMRRRWRRARASEERGGGRARGTNIPVVVPTLCEILSCI
jgi:hypothetical protein